MNTSPRGFASTGLLLAVSVLLAPAPPARAQAPEIPTIGESLGTSIGQTLAAVGGARRAAAELTALIERARERYWSLYPAGEGLQEAEREFALLLQEKDLYYLQERFALQSTGPMVDPRLERAFGAITGGIDGGIHEEAEAEFDRWVRIVRSRYRAGDAQGLADALSETGEAYGAYLKVRNRAEYFLGPKSPLLSQNPQEYVIGVIMRGTQGFPSRAEATQQYNRLGGIVGEPALLEGASKVMQLRRGPDNYHVWLDGELERPEYLITRTILLSDNGRRAIRYLIGRYSANFWVDAWDAAEKNYKRLIAERGEGPVHAAAARVAEAPHEERPYHAERLLHPQQIGCPEDKAWASHCFDHLLGGTAPPLTADQKRGEQLGRLWHVLKSTPSLCVMQEGGRQIEYRVSFSTPNLIEDRWPKSTRPGESTDAFNQVTRQKLYRLLDETRVIEDIDWRAAIIAPAGGDCVRVRVPAKPGTRVSLLLSERRQRGTNQQVDHVEFIANQMDAERLIDLYEAAVTLLEGGEIDESLLEAPGADQLRRRR